MAWIEQHGDGYRVIWREGTTRHKSETFDTKGKANDHRLLVEGQLKARKAIAGMRLLPLSEIVERYIADRTARDRCHRDYAQLVRGSLSRLIKKRGWEDTRDITPASVGVLAVAQHRYLKALLRFAMSLDQPVDQRCVRLRAPARKLKPKAPLFTDAMLLRCFSRAARFNRDLVLAGHLVATYGHRPESLAKATVGCVVDGWITLEVKSGDTIRHPLTAATRSIIAKVTKGRPPDAPLLMRPDGEGGWKDGEALSNYWYHQVGEWANPTAPGIYQLKRRALSRMLGGGLDVATIASITGHRTPSVILTYARTNEARQQAAMKVLEGPGLGGSFSKVPPKCPGDKS